MGTGDGRNLMPEDRAGVLCSHNARLSQRKALDALGVQMNLAMLVAREAFEQFGKRAFRAMAAINEG